ncbi:hypothetical protein MNB_SV-15-201 [hydrothermal vent metagenome]|uniref:Rod shape-determining protein MreD n=1 Tax=hydrothermal vent metagenome TaxID=652676 RepID=A0A1W1EJJ8_9ZZZZ
MSKVDTKKRDKNIIYLWIFVIFYPIIFTLYNFSPPLLGIASYILLDAFEREDKMFISLGIIYMLNIDINFSMPMFLGILTTLFLYIVIYPKLLIINHCKMCLASIIVILFNLIYLELILLYGYIFQIDIIEIDSVLLVYLIFDFAMVFFV